MFGELQNYWKGRNLKALRGSIISRLPEPFVKKFSKHGHFVKFLENELKGRQHLDSQRISEGVSESHRRYSKGRLLKPWV